MKQFYCRCGQRIFFDNTRCVRCGAALGFDPGHLTLKPVEEAAGRDCRNAQTYAVCNWLVPREDENHFCLACRCNEIVPNLDVPGNLDLWGRLEAAKRRLLYALLSLDLPIGPYAGLGGLRFRFLEDLRRNPDVLESFVTTGHVAGTITINLAEADDAVRHAVREQMFERYRTLLGHFRHESGHYYFDYLISGETHRTEFRDLFGDESADYSAAINDYYRDGAPLDWPDRFVSAYAAAHPYEDWAETFAHYLHIMDALETAEAVGLVRPQTADVPGWVGEWMELAVTLNELNRSLGTDDPYPFVLTQPIIAKLMFLDRVVRRRDASAADWQAGRAGN